MFKILSKHKKIISLVAGIFAVLALSLFVSFDGDKENKAMASPGTLSLSGYAWSSNIGWISFSGPTTNGNAYGVTIDDINGNLSGYAWSSNIGWVSFEQADLSGCPSGSCIANLSGGAVTGWAKALSADADNGWDGWIKMSGTDSNGSPYGVTSVDDAVTGRKKLTGFAWGDEVVGWVFFSLSDWGVSYPGTPTGGIPTAPTDLTADNNVPCGKIMLRWTDNSDNEDGFKIYRDGGEIATVGPNITTYFDTPPSIATYEYEVSAFNATGGESMRSDPVITSPQSCAAAGLTATLMAVPSSGQVPFKTTISVTSIDDGISPYKIKEYDCGIGGVSSDFLPGGDFTNVPTQIMKCSYSSPGTYTVTVKIEDADGKSTIPDATVQVNVKPRGIIEI